MNEVVPNFPLFILAALLYFGVPMIILGAVIAVIMNKLINWYFECKERHR